MRKNLLILGMFLLGIRFTNAQHPDCIQTVQLVNIDSLLQRIVVLTGSDTTNPIQIYSRFATHPGNGIAEHYLSDVLTAYGYTVYAEPFGTNGHNIIASKPGYLDAKKAFLFSAHFDCVGNPFDRFQGADDNASGAATVLEAARLLRTTQFPYTIVFALWDEEEQGLIGSKAFAPSGIEGYWDVQLMINMDMLAWDGDSDRLVQIHTAPIGHSEKYATQVINWNDSFETDLHPVIINPGTDATDHKSFWLTGTTAIGFTEDYDNDINPHYHQPSDSMAYLNIPYYHRLSKLAIGSFCQFVFQPVISGLKQRNAEPSFMVYPNPVHRWLYFSGLKQGESLILLQADGRLLQMNYEPDRLDCDGLSPGIYRIGRHSTEGMTYWQQFVYLPDGE